MSDLDVRLAEARALLARPQHNWKATVEVIALGLLGTRVMIAAGGAYVASRNPVAVPALADRSLYLSLDGLDRKHWKGSLALLSLSIFAAGALTGAAVARAKAGHDGPEPGKAAPR